MRIRSITGGILMGLSLGADGAAASEPVMVGPGKALDAAAVQALVLQELPPPPEGIWSIRIVRPDSPMTNPTSGDMAIVVEEMKGPPLDPDTADGRIEGQLRVQDADGRSAHLPFAADVQAMVEVPVPLRPVPAGTILTGDMLGSAWLPAVRLDDELVRSPAEMRRSEVAKRLRPGQPVARSALRPPSAVRRGEPVLITFVRGGLRLTIAGRALEDAAIGQTVRATNPASNREVHGIVSGPGEVALGGSVE
ncbi:MAG TPA: flagellar basal body P-ring formation chaperone FlgA [Geminicoccus sp.]|jgi:flagella basal body P-ring formation protein FlgA|uniref:flagellar basal body P-ring formation chaperone FlgA n=1 Tax=Geminicoccus sp. TaxID=2024832 RepID=UPI002E36F918|nr:flagellar basal body P-ring formation chaperone FlgA [Geminicoccus sp.]HEX2525528.1 flagellar basal body P-ring formation chaperone FlgA [Geminicoccus sp.]